MLMSYIFTGFLAVSLVSAIALGRGSELAAATAQGAAAGVTLAVSMASSVCLWCGVGKLMEKVGLTEKLSRLFSPLLGRIFPTFRKDPKLAGSLSANVCANFLGLGNAATPMGIQAAQRLTKTGRPGVATDELCRLVVLNTASIQLIPANVAAVRTSLSCETPFDILPCVWITSLLSASGGVLMAWLLGKLWRK